MLIFENAIWKRNKQIFTQIFNKDEAMNMFKLFKQTPTQEEIAELWFI